MGGSQYCTKILDFREGWFCPLVELMDQELALPGYTLADQVIAALLQSVQIKYCENKKVFPGPSVQYPGYLVKIKPTKLEL